MRRLLFCVVCLCATLTASAAEVEFLRVWPAWRDAESFERISEFFGRGENTGRETILRTQSADRGGYYFLVRAKSAAAISAVRFSLSVIRPDAPEPKTFTFSTPLPANETVFQLGLTGADWPGGKDIAPVAWRVALLSDDGRVLAEQNSFLWEKPAK